MNIRGKNTQILNNFDYDTLDSKQRSIVQLRTEEIKERLKRSAQDIWEIGQKIFEVRSQLAYGNFDRWLKAEFGWSRRTAYNFIQVYEAFPERATVAQVSIAASALYQLSSPSTPQKIRDELIQRAKQGEKITRQDIRLATKQEQISSTNTAVESEPIGDVKQQIVSIIPQSTNSLQPLSPTRENQKSSIASEPEKSFPLSEGWYCLENKHFLFYGDTASAQFYQVIPQVPLTIAITSNDWDHDWLIDKSDNLIVLKESFLEPKSISTFISLLSQPGDIVLFPWLPEPNIIGITHQLDRVIVAGDSILERCQSAIAQSKLKIQAVSQPQ